jgi:transposase
MSPEEKRIVELEQENKALRKIIAELTEKIAFLERRLKLSSETSSKPPSSDGLKKKKKRTKSLREKGKRKTGGQPGHQGQTLKQVEEPDEIIKHKAPKYCGECGTDVSREKVDSIIARQVFEIPPPRMEVVEHRVERKKCPRCSQRVEGSFPPQVKAPVQYGNRIKGVASYLHHQHFVPEDRLSEVLSDLFDCGMTPGTIAKNSKDLAKNISSVVEKISSKVKAAEVKNLDETGFRIGGKTNWLHVVSNEILSWYRVAPQRKDLEPLTGIKGVVIHDHWKPYYQLPGVSHGLCNAHHLRELKALEEIEQESWATSMTKLLTLGCRYRHRYGDKIPEAIITRLTKLYDQIIERGLTLHRSQPPLPRKSNRGRPKRRVGHNLLLRLKDYGDDVLRFLSQAQVPFTNNQAERDLRMMKCKQKISGGFRRFETAVDFANIRSFLSTARKQDFNILDAITLAFSGQPPLFS